MQNRGCARWAVTTVAGATRAISFNGVLPVRAENMVNTTLVEINQIIYCCNFFLWLLRHWSSGYSHDFCFIGEWEWDLQSSKCQENQHIDDHAGFLAESLFWMQHFEDILVQLCCYNGIKFHIHAPMRAQASSVANNACYANRVLTFKHGINICDQTSMLKVSCAFACLIEGCALWQQQSKQSARMESVKIQSGRQVQLLRYKLFDDSD